METWEVRDLDERKGGGPYNVERGDERDYNVGLEIGAERISDYNVALIVEAALNLRDGNEAP